MGGGGVLEILQLLHATVTRIGTGLMDHMAHNYVDST